MQIRPSGVCVCVGGGVWTPWKITSVIGFLRSTGTDPLGQISSQGRFERPSVKYVADKKKVLGPP